MLNLRNVLAFVCALLAPSLYAAKGDELLRVHFIDVGQGDAIWIQGPAGECTPEGLNVLIDGGPDSGANNRLITYLETYKLKRDSVIDYAIVSHPHDDHYPGLIDVLKVYQVRTVVEPGFPEIGPKYRKFLDLARAEKVGSQNSTLVEMRKQPSFQFPACTDLRLSILFADSNQTGLGSGNSRVNNASTVVRLEYKNFSFLFVGDLEGKGRKDSADVLTTGEKALLSKASPASLRATVLKVGHHGSETSSTLALIRAVQPDVIVVESGRKAFSGTFLPDSTVLERYKKERPQALIVRTDEGDEAAGLDTMNDADGDDIAILTDGDSLRVRQAKQTASGGRRWVTIKTIQK
jgi:beta-lactamase superfamily II metal-dependent hydrolase